MQSRTEVINSSLIEHGSERFEQIDKYLRHLSFTIDLYWGGHETDLTLGHRYKKKSEINKF